MICYQCVLYSEVPHIIVTSEIRTAYLQGTVVLIPMCPLFRGSAVSFCAEIRKVSLQGTVDLIPMCPLFRDSTVSELRHCLFQLNM